MLLAGVLVAVPSEQITLTLFFPPASLKTDPAQDSLAVWQCVNGNLTSYEDFMYLVELPRFSPRHGKITHVPSASALILAYIASLLCEITTPFHFNVQN